MDINPVDLRYFFEVAKFLNISRAAERLNIGQPALSQAIQRLELVLSVKLFDRFKTGVQLTPAGKNLLTEGRLTLESWTRLKQTVQASEKKVEGNYTIGCHPSVAIFALPTSLKKLTTLHPDLKITLTHGLSREVAEDIINFRADFGLVINPARHPDLVIKELGRDSVSFWAAPNVNKDVVIYDPSLNQSQYLLRKLGAKNSFARSIQSSNLEVVASLAEAGCGVAILPGRIAERYPKLKRYGKDFPVFSDQLCLVFRADRLISAGGRAIIDTFMS